MLNLQDIKQRMPSLQRHPWPPVAPFEQLEPGFAAFLWQSRQEQVRTLRALRANPEQHSRTLHAYLSCISAYLFGYADSPLYRQADDVLEIALQQAKIVLERELMAFWLHVMPVPQGLNQVRAAEYIRKLATDNPSLSHPLFDYLSHEANQEALHMFLRTEVTRTEVVDDEVGMMLAGLQGPMKLAIVSNLWDECGRGRLENFHTYWLRRLLDKVQDWKHIQRYRVEERPWCTQITTNAFNILLTRPGLRLMAYGWFLINESWVPPHFDKLLQGMRRVGLSDDDLTIYFDAHVRIDAIHTEELTGAMEIQQPSLAPVDVEQLLQGAHMAIAASTAQYDQMLRYLRTLTESASQG